MRLDMKICIKEDSKNDISWAQKYAEDAAVILSGMKEMDKDDPDFRAKATVVKSHLKHVLDLMSSYGY